MSNFSFSVISFSITSVTVITGSALALHCCKAHAKINRKIDNSTPCTIVTHEIFNLKLGPRDYVVDITNHATFRLNRYSGGFHPNRGNITLLWLFCYPVLFSRSFAKVEPSHRFLRWIAHMACFAQGRFFGGQDDGWRHAGKMCPKNFPKRGVNRQLQAKTPKSIHRNMSGTINPTNKRFEDRVQTTKSTSCVVHHYPKANTTWLTAAILKLIMTSYFCSGWSDLDEIRQRDAE